MLRQRRSFSPEYKSEVVKLVQGVELRYRFIVTEKAVYPVRLMCCVLQVSRRGYYAWRTRPQSTRAQADQRLLVALRAAFGASRRTLRQPRACTGNCARRGALTVAIGSHA